MTDVSHRVTATVASLLVASLALAAVPSAGTAVLPHEDRPRNQTVTPVSIEDHQPGIDDASYYRFAAPNEDPGFESIRELGYSVTRWEDGVINRCGPDDIGAAGIDRGNDDPGTETDVEVISYVEDQGGSPHQTYTDFTDSGDFGEQALNFNATDQFVGHLVDCWQNPEEPGWYQVYAKINGTTYGGEYAEFPGQSHWFWICDCESTADARQQLGPPPSETGSTGATTTPTTTTASTPTATPGSTATATPATDTPTGTAAADGTTPSGTTTTAASTTAAATDTPTPTETTEPTTPAGGSDGGSPGFGAAVALVALLSAGLVAIRRR